MSGFFRTPRFFALAAAALALAGAAGWGLPLAVGDPATVLIDASASSAPPAIAGTRFTHSDLQRAVREGAAKRVLLYTDGCDTGGEMPMDPGFPVDVVLLPRRDHALLLSLQSPLRAGVSESFGVRVTVGRTAGDPAPPRAYRVRLERDGERVGAERTVLLERGRTASVNFVDSVENPGIVRYEATVVGGPGGRSAYVRVGHEPLVGVIGRTPAWNGFRFESAVAQTPYDAYLVSAPIRDPALRSAIEGRVRAGAGLLALGASDAPLLPLTENPPEGRAAVVLLDISGSMEPHLAALRQGFFELCARMDPADRIALVRFRGGVVDATGWVDAADGASLWTTPVARGATELGPAIAAANRLLLEAEARHRRIYVVSDGQWEEGVTAPDLHRAALFVTDDPPKHALDLFPIHARGAVVLTTALRKLEEEAPDRWVRDTVSAQVSDPFGWLRGALAARDFARFPRLYPKGADERVALASGEIPIVAARIEGGRIVQAAAPAAAGEAMLRACIAEQGTGLRAWRVGRGLEIEARGGSGAAFSVGERSVPARVRGPDRWGASLASVPAAELRVTRAGATVTVPALADAEERGLFPDEEFARALARVSGGRFNPPDASNPQRSVAVYATLLGAAVLILASAWLRRRR